MEEVDLQEAQVEEDQEAQVEEDQVGHQEAQVQEALEVQVGHQNSLETTSNGIRYRSCQTKLYQ